MLSGNSNRYYLSSLANLIAAFGGGLILGKGIGILNLSYIRGGSILAFFIGTVLGLIFLQCIPKKWSNSFANCFSISGGITSLILLYILKNNFHNGQLSGSPALLFFVFLCIRFGFWFYSRVMRASNASRSQHSVAWVEMGYYLGMVLGLIIWKLLNFEIGLSTALVIDASLQFSAGYLDLKNSSLNKSIPQEEKKIESCKKIDSIYSLKWCWKLTGAVVFLTIAIQVVLFNAAHQLLEIPCTYLIATFYLGVAGAAYLCNKYKIYLSWNKVNFLAYVRSNLQENIRIKFSCFYRFCFRSNGC